MLRLNFFSRCVMKKLLCLCLFIIFVLSGCKAPKEVEVISEGISFNASVEFGELQADCFVEAYGGGMFSCRVDSPEEIAGLTADFNGEEVTLSYGGLSKAFETPLPAESLAEIIRKVTAVSQNKTAESDGETHTLSGIAGGCSYTLTVAPSGLPLCLSCPQLDFKAEFSSHKIMK